MGSIAMIKRIIAYFKSRPSGDSWRFFAFTFPIWAIVTYLFLQLTGFFALATYDFTSGDLLVWSLVYMVMPSILEEAIYRPVFFPLEMKLRSRSFAIRTLISTAIFVAVHPLNAFFFMPSDFDVFSDWRFLVAVAILGFYCSVLLVRTKSIYLGILTHYAMVMVWKFVMCGRHVAS